MAIPISKMYMQCSVVYNYDNHFCFNLIQYNAIQHNAIQPTNYDNHKITTLKEIRVDYTKVFGMGFYRLMYRTAFQREVTIILGSMLSFSSQRDPLANNGIVKTRPYDSFFMFYDISLKLSDGHIV